MFGFLTLAGLGLILGALLAAASLFLSTETDNRVQQLLEILPGYNCGICGRPGCAGYAEGLVSGVLTPGLCRPGGPAVKQKIAAVLGLIIPDESEKNISCVFCNGGVRAIDAYAYSGIASCQAAVLVQGGYKKCRWGCLGFGDCAAVCNLGAITLSEEGLPVIDGDKCMDCGLCYKTCPRGLLKSIPRKEIKLVRCSNHDNGKAARAVCAAACIACGICIKQCPYGAITLKDNLAVIDPAKCTNCGKCVSKCATKALG